jgi:hypothetical protein
VTGGRVTGGAKVAEDASRVAGDAYDTVARVVELVWTVDPTSAAAGTDEDGGTDKSATGVVGGIGAVARRSSDRLALS